MRITGGIYKGRKLKVPPGIIRPAMDRMRESIFSILGDLSGKSFLDLFSGSGIIGIEAASRGANPVHLVEKDYRKKNTILKNISFIGTGIYIHIKPVIRYLKSAKDKFNLIFMDPPFLYKEKLKIINYIGEKNILKRDGILIIHFPQEENIPSEVEYFSLTDKRKYGRSMLYLFHRRDNLYTPSLNIF